MKIATVYERNGIWYFEPSSRSTTGIWVATPPLVTLGKEASRERKSEAAIEALRASQQGVPVPVDPNAPSAPLLALAKVRSWASFMKTSKCIALELENGQMKVVPQKKLARPKGGLESLPERAIHLPESVPPEELGAALEQAMARSE